jgi:predicted esterase
VRVAWVLPGGPAAKAGIAAGDVIESIADAEGGQAPFTVDSAAALAGLLAGLAPGQTAEVTTSRQGRRAAAKVVTAPLPADVPEGGPPAAAQQGAAPGGPIDAATVIRLEAADVADPPLAVLPRVGKSPVGVLVYFAIPHGPVTESEAAVWKAVAARHGIAVILPGSGDPRQWSRDDIPDVSRALASLQTRRQIDPGRIAVAGSGPGAAFAWLVAERMEGLVSGVALVDSGLPRQARIDPAEPGRSLWVLLGAGEDEAGRARLAADRRRLEEAGLTVGTLPKAGAETPADLLGRWVSLLGLL